MCPSPTPPNLTVTGRRFELIERIGSGAFGEVFLANQVSGAGFSRSVALKLLHPDRFGEDDAARRIRDEARVLGRLHHPHIVQVMDLVRLDAQWAVVMEHVEGADLEHILLALHKAGRVFPAAAVLELVSHVADALDAAYNAESSDGSPLRVVHRDIKPANLRLTPNGDIKVLDFGIARASMVTREAQTGAYVIGTQRYMAPERIAGRDVGAHGDVYSLAATTYELLTGEPLGRSPVLTDRHEVWVRERLRLIGATLGGVPETRQRVAGLLLSCLRAEPLDRLRAADLSQRAGSLSRELPGEELRAFGRRFVPQVSSLLGRSPDRVTGVLTEGTTASSPLDPPNTTLREPRGDLSTDELDRPSMLLPALLVATLVVVIGAVAITLGLAGGVGVWWVMSSPEAEGDLPEFSASEGPVPLPDPQAAPTSEPSVDPARSVDAVPPAPAEPAPRPARSAQPPAVAPVAPSPPPEGDEAPRVLSRALFSVPGATGITVRCGAVRSAGTASARIMSFPEGSCAVHAIVDGRELHGEAEVRSPRTITCTPQDQGLQCD